MAYRESGYRGNPAWVGIVVFLLMLGWCVARTGGGHARVSPETVATELTSNPEGGSVFKAIGESFPKDMDRLTADLSNRANSGADQQTLATITRDFVADLSRQHRNDLANTPHPNLAAIEQAQFALIDYLRGTSPQLCAKFDASGVTLDELPAGEARQRLAALLAAQWRGMGAGRDAPVARNTATFAQSDKQALLAAMRRDGLSSPEYTALKIRAAAGSISPEIGCGIAVHTIRAIQALPADQGDRVMGWLVRQQAS
ncbi:MAG: hypothetical protein ABIS51_14830 [Sphingomonas sp.]